MSGILYLVGTPIGNLSDLSPRGLQTLRDADFIAAEDTRVTLKLLNRFEIPAAGKLLSYHEHNKRERGLEILARLQNGENGALVTDAGMPCISDPGEDLVRLCAEAGISVRAVPGPSAVIAALAVSGLPTARFSFEGFLSVNRKNRRRHLEEIKNDRRTLVFYEAPHKLPGTLKDLHEALGDRRIAVVRELTKIHEEVRRTTLAQAAAEADETKFKGEIVLVVEGAREIETAPPTEDEALELARRYLAEGRSPAAAAKAAAAETGFRKGELYKKLIEID